MDATYCKAHPRACNGAFHAGEWGRLIDKTKGVQNSKLHATCDAEGRLCDIFLTRGEASDYKGGMN